MNKKIIKRLIFGTTLLMAIFLSLYSISAQTWVWNNGELHQKILGTASGLAAFSGVIATIYFYKRYKSAYFYAMANAILFGTYALSINLTGDFIVNLFWYIPIFIILLINERKERKSRIRKLNIFSSIFLLILFISSYFFFWYITPKINELWGNILNSKKVSYGTNFNHYWLARILDTLSNSICVVALLMMVLGYKVTWLIWIPKNISALIFFSGVGVINISIIIMNIIYILISTFLIYKVSIENKKIHIAITGPGAVGKTTTIKYLSSFLDERNIIKIDERSLVENEKFEEYMDNLKDNAFEAQKNFYNKRFRQILEMQHYDLAIMDRHAIDDFIFPEVHINMGNFTNKQKRKWTYYHLRQWWRLMTVKKLDFIFVLVATDDVIEKRREKRIVKEKYRENEIKNKTFFRKVNKKYHDKNSIMYKAANKFSKRILILENIDSKKTAEIIKKELLKII